MPTPSTTPNLGLTLLDSGLRQPEVPINTNWNILDSAVGGAAVSLVISAVAYGAVANAQVIEDAGMTSGSATLTSTTGGFTSTLIGRVIAVAGAGSSGATLITTISGVPSSTSLTLGTNASTTISGTRAVHGTNNTTAVQNALNAAATMGLTVYLPEGNYLFSTGSLSLPQGVSLQGSWKTAPYHLGYRYTDEQKPMSGKGTTMVVVAGEGSATGRFIMVNSHAAVRGICIFYPAERTALSSPKLYPWTIEMFGADCVVEHVELVNPYQGIYSHIGHRHVVRDINGMPLSVGLYASQQLATSIYEDVSFGPVYSYAVFPETTPFPLTALNTWVHQNGIAFKVGRVDNAIFLNCNEFSYYKGVKIVVDSSETTTFANGTGAPGGKAWAQFLGCLWDTSSYPCDIDDAQGADSTGAAGVTFDSCVFASSQISAFAGPELYSVFCRTTFTGRVGLANCRFHLGNKLIVNAATAGKINAAGCYFQTWTTGAIDLAGGTATISGSSFKGSNGTPVITASSTWLTIAGNHFDYAEHLVYSITNCNFNDSGNSYADGPIQTAVSFQNSWGNLGGGYQNVTYIKENGRVYLRGAAAGGTATPVTTLFTLPTGHRPPATITFPVNSNGALGVIQVASSGVVSILAGTNTSLFFDGIDFSVR